MRVTCYSGRRSKPHNLDFIHNLVQLTISDILAETKKNNILAIDIATRECNILKNH